MDLQGKKLLVLGANPTEIFIVKSAQSKGVHVIVTDNHENLSDAPAKLYSNEYWNISWSDIDSLEQKCKLENIDGVLAGFSEFRVEAMIKLCQRLNLPCYITDEQLEITRDKIKFKLYCERFNIPTVKQFNIDEDPLDFPVIVKPVDRAGSIGIKVCYNLNDYSEAKEKALELSPTGKIIVEKYLGNAQKFDLYYCVQKGNPIFIGSNDTLMCPQSPTLEILQSSWIFPSRFEDYLKSQLNDKISNMLKDLGIDDGYITISGFIDSQKRLYVFETGFRLSGELSFKYSNYAYGIDYLNFLIEKALGGESADFRDVQKTNKGRVLVVNYYGRSGEIKAMSDSVTSPNCEIVNYKRHSFNISKPIALLPKCGMLFIYGFNYKEIIKTYNKEIDSYQILDHNNRDLVYYRPSCEMISQFVSF